MLASVEKGVVSRVKVLASVEKGVVSSVKVLGWVCGKRCGQQH